MSKPPPVTGTAEIVLSVADLPTMRSFYSQVMGFTLHSEFSMEGNDHDPNGAATISFLKICDTDTPLGRGGHPQLLALIDFQRHVFAKGRFLGHDVRRSTLNHLAFEIPPDAFDNHATRLRALGLDVTFSEFPGMQARAMFFRDPEGNLLELICHQPASAAGQAVDPH